MKIEGILQGTIPEELASRFADVCDFHGKDALVELQKCMTNYVAEHADTQVDIESMSGKEISLYSRVCQLMDLFDDMQFDPDSIVGPYTKVRYQQKGGALVDGEIPIPHEIRYFDPQGYSYHMVPVDQMEAYGQYDFMNRSLTLREDTFGDDTVLLHEMIHMHEHAFLKADSFYREILFLSLYNDLKPKLAQEGIDLDAKIFGHANVAEAQRLTIIGGEHSILFYLKSLDLDLKMGYDLGTICGYGRA